jgi:hypothetical protein
MSSVDEIASGNDFGFVLYLLKVVLEFAMLSMNISAKNRVF